MVKYSDTVKAFRLEDGKLDELVRYQAAFQNFVIVVANLKCGVNVLEKDWHPQYIYKCEGGMMVNGHDIVLGNDAAYPDYGRQDRVIPEEQAAVDALDYVVGHMKKDGIKQGLAAALEQVLCEHPDWTKEQKEELFQKIAGNKVQAVFGGDPWRRFFGAAWDKVIREANDKAKKEGKESCYF